MLDGPFFWEMLLGDALEILIDLLSEGSVRDETP